MSIKLPKKFNYLEALSTFFRKIFSTHFSRFVHSTFISKSDTSSVGKVIEGTQLEKVFLHNFEYKLVYPLSFSLCQVHSSSNIGLFTDDEGKNASFGVGININGYQGLNESASSNITQPTEGNQELHFSNEAFR